MTHIEKINQAVLQLWRDMRRQRIISGTTPCPLLYPKLSTGGLLTIGFNPSLAGNLPSFESVYRTKQTRDKLIADEDHLRKTLPYYSPFRTIRDQLGIAWAHVDWFFSRGHPQPEVEKELITARSPFELTAFGKKQVELSRRLMEITRPRLVLVATARGSQIAKQQFELRSDLDHDGLLWGKVGKREVPFFLSGMLSGSRALDCGSRQRLVWHMRRAVNRLKD